MTEPGRREDYETNDQGAVVIKGFVLDVPPDAPDIRDRMYDAALIRIPNEIAPEWSALNIRNQHQEGACTGFALAAAIDLLNQRRAFRWRAASDVVRGFTGQGPGRRL